MDNILYIILMIVIIIGSRVLKSFFNKTAKQKLDAKPDKMDEYQAINDEEDTGKGEKSVLEELFKDYFIKKENQVYNKTAVLKEESIKKEDISPLDIEIKKLKETKVEKKVIQEEEIVIEPEVKNPVISSENKIEDNILDKEPPLDRIKKLNYMEQAIVLSEILGKPKGFDI
jgi:hypothetical protein